MGKTATETYSWCSVILNMNKYLFKLIRNQ
jgi:hypothetical protein